MTFWAHSVAVRREFASDAALRGGSALLQLSACALGAHEGKLQSTARQEAVFKSVAAALLVTLAADGGYLPVGDLMRDIAAAARDLLPDITAEEMLEAVRAIATALRSSGFAALPLH